MSATSQMSGTQIVRVRMERGRSGFLFARTDDIDGLVLSASTPEELRKMLPGAIECLYASCGVKVIVTPVQVRSADDEDGYAALPVELAKRKLDEMAAAH